MKQGVGDEGVEDLVDFRRIGFEKFAPGRGVEEEFLDFNLGAVSRHGAGTQVELFPTPHVKRPSVGTFLGLCFDDDIRDGADGIEGLAAKAQRLNVIKVIGLFDLAGCVAQEDLFQVIVLDAVAVVFDFNQSFSGFLQRDFNGSRAGVEGVLSELLDDRGGPFDHLPGGDLADDVFFEDVDFGHCFIEKQRGKKQRSKERSKMQRIKKQRE